MAGETPPTADSRLVSAAAVVSAVFLAGVLATSAVAGIVAGTNFGGYPADGPFQLYNPLRRLAAGELVGRDFPFFHGPGTLLVHYPIFGLLGSNIFASEVSRWLTSPIVFLASGLFFLKMLLRTWPRTLIAAAFYTALVFPVELMVTPSNSLLGVRTALPLVAAGFLLWHGTRGTRRWRFLEFTPGLLGAVLTLGLAFSFATEHGLAAILAFLVVRLVGGVRSAGWWRGLVRTAVEGVAVAVSVLLFSTLLSAGNPVDALRYALGAIPQDQGWVFGAPPNTTFSWGALSAQLTDFSPPRLVEQLRQGTSIAGGPLHLMAVAGAVLLAAVAVRRRRLAPSVLPAFALLALHGLAALVGLIGYVYLADQLAALGRNALLVAAGAAIALLLPRLTEPTAEPAAAVAAAGTDRSSRVRSAAATRVAAVVAIVAVVGYATVSAVRDLHGVRRALAAAPAAVGAPDSAVLGDGWRATMATVDRFVGPDDTVWSTYTGLAQSMRGQLGFSPGGEDYTIHAVGAERRAAYEQAFAEVRPDAVITMNPQTFPYEEWMWSKWPGFYTRLFTEYELRSIDTTYGVWTRTGGADPAGGDRATARQDGEAYALPANRGADTEVYSVTVAYRAEAPVSALTRATRYLLVPDGTALTLPVSLPPYEEEWTFLVPVLPGQDAPTLTPTAVGEFGGSLDVERVTYERVDVPPENARFFELAYCTAAPDEERCAAE